jgi:hypothetical protein
MLYMLWLMGKLETDLMISVMNYRDNLHTTERRIIVWMHDS